MFLLYTDNNRLPKHWYAASKAGQFQKDCGYYRGLGYDVRTVTTSNVEDIDTIAKRYVNSDIPDVRDQQAREIAKMRAALAEETGVAVIGGVKSARSISGKWVTIE